MARASAMGLSVHGAHLSGDMIGCYVHELRRIYFDLDLTIPDRRSSVAHELGHAHYGHGCDDPYSERQADTYAAMLLVDPDRYAALEQINHDAEWIAEEMNVAPWIILDFRRYCLRRYGQSTYTRPRMGSGQWDHFATL